MASKKRPSSKVAQSPVTRLTQELSVLSYSDVPIPSSQGSSQGVLSQSSCTGEGIYCTPEFQAGDFCTPDDQVQELNWSQGSQDPQQEAAVPQQWGLCPPTPDVSKRRKTKGGGGKQEKFMYNLDPLAEEDDPAPQSAAAPKKNQPAAPSKPSKQMSLQSWFTPPSSVPSGGLLFSSKSESSSPAESPPREAASSRHSFPQGQQKRKVGAAACNTNPFVRESLTEQEKRTPSRPLPVLPGGAKASRYLQEFEELRVLGRGGAGEVFLARSRADGCLYAVKRGQAVARSQRERALLFVEVYALAALAHVPHVVRYYGAWYEHDQLHIQMEVCDCTLAERFGGGRRAGDAALVRVLSEVGAALEGMHAAGMAHLDVKPDNVYCKGPHFRLGDLGLCHSPALLALGRLPQEGDGRYAAPEAVAGLSQRGDCALAPCDVFSLGATLLELAWAAGPLHVDLPDYHAVRRGAPVELRGRPELLGGHPELLAAALSRMLRPDPEHRATAAEAREAGEQLWWHTAEGRAKGEGEVAALRAEVAALRERNRVLEKSVEALNCSGIDTSLTDPTGDPEPFGSQESPSASYGGVGPCAVTPPPSGLFDGGAAEDMVL